MVLTSDDLNTIKGLLHYLNDNLPGADLDVDIEIGDSNGNRVGTISFGVEDVEAYVFVPSAG